MSGRLITRNSSASAERGASGVMTPNSATKNIDVAIPLDADELRLVVTDAGDGVTSDHADWANARIY